MSFVSALIKSVYIALSVCQRSSGAVDLGPSLEATLTNALVHHHPELGLSLADARVLFHQLRTNSRSDDSVQKLLELADQLTEMLAPSTGGPADEEERFVDHVGVHLGRRYAERPKPPQQ